MRKMTGEEFDPYVRFFDGMAQTNWLGAVHNELKKLSGSWEEKKVLDIGCGTGRLLLRGVDEATLVEGIDLSENMIAKAKAIYEEKAVTNAHFRVGDAYDLPYEDEEFDIALSTCVFFLLPEPERGLKEMVRVVKAGGTLVMLNPSERMSQETAANYCQRYQLEGFEEKTLMQWSNISTKRHRYNQEQLTQLLKSYGASFVSHQEVVDGLALITVAKRS